MIFEIISSQHLELSSEVAERARDVARARDFLKGGEKSERKNRLKRSTMYH